jgi:predicted transcriptional regulator
MSKTGKNYFPTPNEIFSLGLSPGEFAVYSYLLRCENRRTHQCWPSYKTIGSATGMSVNTVRKHICALADKGLISTEDTTVFTRTGLKHNGSLLYTIRPFQEVLDAHQQNELRRLEIETAKWEYAKTASL